jgi:MFS family permease
VEGLGGDNRRAGLVWWLTGATALLLLRVASNSFLPGIAHDSFQYLSVADQALQGHIGETGIVHFDAERSFGRLPAPLVTFPLGYPALLAALSLTGMSLMRAALVVNIAATLGCITIAWWLTGRFGLRPGIRHAIMACIAANGALLQFAATASTEMTFTLLVLVATALLFKAQSSASGMRWWVAAGLALGVSYHVRYAGLFLIVGLFGVAAWHLLSRHRARFVGYVVAAATAAMLVVAGMARNVALVGNWRGGNEKVVRNDLQEVLATTVRAVNGVVLGPPGTAPQVSLVLRLAFVVCVAFAVILLWRRRDSTATVVLPTPVRDFTIDLLMLVGAYSAFMFYAALTTVISYGTRMFVPVIPVLALIFGVWLSRWVPTNGAPLVHRAPALAAAFVLYLAVNAISFANPLVNRAAVVRAQLDEPTRSGATVRQLIEGTGRGVVVANHGQALGFLLGRPTVSLVGPHYSNTVWDEKTMRDVVSRYAASVLVMTAPSNAQPLSTDLLPSAFVDSLSRGMSPGWLRLAGQSGAVSVYVPTAQP